MPGWQRHPSFPFPPLFADTSGKKTSFLPFVKLNPPGNSVTVNEMTFPWRQVHRPIQGPGPPTSSWKPARSQPRDLTVEKNSEAQPHWMYFHHFSGDPDDEVPGRRNRENKAGAPSKADENNPRNSMGKHTFHHSLSILYIFYRNIKDNCHPFSWNKVKKCGFIGGFSLLKFP